MKVCSVGYLFRKVISATIDIIKIVISVTECIFFNTKLDLFLFKTKYKFYSCVALSNENAEQMQYTCTYFYTHIHFMHRKMNLL